MPARLASETPSEWWTRSGSRSSLVHFNICTPDIPAAYAHYRSLGFGCSETTEDDEHELYAAWTYRKQTVHDVAFTSGARSAPA